VNNELDISLLRFIHHHRIVALDAWLYGLSFITTYVSIGIVLSILIISLVKKSKPMRVIFFKMLAVLVIGALVSLSLKTMITRDRPFVTYPDIEKLSEAGSSSFPSGHTIEVFAMATALSLLIPKKRIAIPVFSWALLVAYSRMALGVHYPGDVMAGMAIGILIGWLVPFLIGKAMERSKKPVQAG
jgi:membrane-associated phospholipid phosphatase